MWSKTKALSCFLLVWAALSTLHLEAQIVGDPCVFSDRLALIDVPLPTGLLEQNGLVYSSSPDGVINIIDASDPLSMGVVGSYQIASPKLNNGTRSSPAMAHRAGYLYLSPDGVGLEIVDVTAPSSPVFVSRTDFGSPYPPFAHGLAVSGTVLYFATGSDLLSIDVSDPASPSVISAQPFPIPVSIPKLLVDGELLFAAGVDLAIYNIAVPHKPEHISTITTPGITLDCLYERGLLHLSSVSDGLLTYNIDDPKNPELLSSLALPGGAYALHLQGDRVVISSDEPSIHVVSIASPATPTIVRRTSAPVTYRSLALFDDAAVGSYFHSIGTWPVHRVRGVAAPDPTIAAASTGSPITEIALDGDRALTVGDDGHGLQIIDVSDPSSPTPLGIFGAASDYTDIAVLDNHAYTSHASQGFRVVDISDSKNPERVSPRIGADVSQIQIENRVVYVLERREVSVMNVNDPASPQVIGHNARTDAEMFCVSGSVVYAVEDSRAHNIIVADFNDPESPVVLGNIDAVVGLNDTAWTSVALYEETLYAADEEGWLWVIDVSSPSDSTRTARRVLIDETFRRVRIDGDVMLLSGAGMPVQVYRLSDGESMNWQGAIGDTAGFVGTFIRDNIMFASQKDKLVLVDLGDDCKPVCAADTNHDGVLTGADFTAWIASFNTGSSECDQDNDGSCTASDFGAWLANYNAGC